MAPKRKQTNNSTDEKPVEVKRRASARSSRGKATGLREQTRSPDTTKIEVNNYPTTHKQEILGSIGSSASLQHPDNRTNDSTAVAVTVTPAAATSSQIVSPTNIPSAPIVVPRVLRELRPLPAFSGDPLDWPLFKAAYEISTRSADYDDHENVLRLYEALKGEARSVVRTLFAIGRPDPGDVMSSLELCFGSRHALGRRLSDQIYGLPAIAAGGRIGLTRFAAKLKNAVDALKSCPKLAGYLYSLDLLKSVEGKMPEVWQYSLSRYRYERLEDDASDLEKLSDFVYGRTEMAVRSGLFDI